MNNTYTRRGFTQKVKNIAVYKNCHSKLDLESLTLAVGNNPRGSSRIKYGMTLDWITARRFVFPPLVIPTLQAADYAGYSRSKGFTLIELLVVVLIIGILAAVAVPQYQKAVEKSRAAEIALFLQEAHKAVALYQLAHGTADKTFYLYGTTPVTNALNELDVDLSGMVTKLSESWGVEIMGDADGTYVNLMGISDGPEWASDINSTVSPAGKWSGGCMEGGICSYLNQHFGFTIH